MPALDLRPCRFLFDTLSAKIQTSPKRREEIPVASWIKASLTGRLSGDVMIDLGVAAEENGEKEAREEMARRNMDGEFCEMSFQVGAGPGWPAAVGGRGKWGCGEVGCAVLYCSTVTNLRQISAVASVSAISRSRVRRVLAVSRHYKTRAPIAHSLNPERGPDFTGMK